MTQQVQEAVSELRTANEALLHFRKEHKEILEQLMVVRKQVNAAKKRCVQAMQDAGIDAYEVEGTADAFYLSKRTRTKHDMELLKDLLEDDQKVQSYVESTVNATASVQQKRKRAAKDDI